MKYYLHNSNSFNDEKITELYIHYGYEGLGLFYTLLEKIAFQEKPIKTSILKSQLRVGKRLEKCWQFMEDIGLIQSDNGETYNLQLMNYIENYKKKSDDSGKRVSKHRNKLTFKDDVTHYNSVCNDPKVNISKIKENNIITDGSEIPILNPNEEFLLSIPLEWQAVVRKWLDFKKDKQQPYKGLTSLTTMFDKLMKYSNGNPDIGSDIIENSISNNYSGFFELKQNDHGTNKISNTTNKITKNANDKSIYC